MQAAHSIGAAAKIAPRTNPSTLSQFLLPNLAAMLAVATLGYCLFVFDAGHQLLRDADSGWHIRNGEAILSHFTLPRTDPYSFSRPGAPWVAWEWGSDVLLGLAHSWDGLRGVVEMTALAICASMWLCVRLQFAVGGDFLIAALFTPLIVTTASMHWLARPHIFGWLFLLGAVLYAERIASGTVRPMLWIAAAGTALWANLHASFFLAPAVALIYAGAHWAQPWIWPSDTRREQQTAREFFLLALASAAGSFLNPYGWKLHAHVFSYLANSELTSRIAEFQSFNFHDRDATQVTLTVIIALAGAVLALSRRRLAHAVMALMFTWGALRYARLLPIVALLILPLVNGALTQALREAYGLRPRLRQALDRALDYSARLRAIDRKLTGAAFLALSAIFLLSSLHAPVLAKEIGFSAAAFPVEAAQAVDALPAGARVLAPDSYGGYLIYRFNGSRKVYFDGRSDFYGADFMKQYVSLAAARPGWQKIVATFHFTHALLPNQSPLEAALVQSGWKTLHRDDVATLLEAP